MKTLEMVIKMHSSYSKSVKFPKILQNDSEN